MLKTVDNYQGELDISQTKAAIKKLPENLGYQGYLSSAKKKMQALSVNVASFKCNNVDNILFDMLGSADKRDDDDLICSVYQTVKDNVSTFVAQTGNYVGKFTWDGLEVDVRSRFSDVFMKRMLNCANDVFLDDVSAFDAEESKGLDFSKFIIYYMFVQKLERAFLLGLPKSYSSIQHHDMKLKGRIDINRFIKRDIPFQGKISATSREQKEIQEIIDVLHKAVQVIDKPGHQLCKNISHIKTHLKQYKSSLFVSKATIQKAMASKALQNPIFAPYKSVLEYAKLIIDGSNLQESAKGKGKTFGFLVNVAELFELYISKLLQKEFSDWSVVSPQLQLDKEFGDSYLYNRKIIPDIVMQHRESNKVMVFDTKYKRMKFTEIKGNGVDIDRNDFFQINTYMNYYNNQSQYNLIAGGLLYPMEKEFKKDNCHANQWLGDKAVKFIVDGIDLHELNESKGEKELMQDIQNREAMFIDRIKGLCDIR